MSDQEAKSAKSEKPKFKLKTWHVLTIVAFIIALWVSNWVFAVCFYGAANAQGQFGDQFGAVNALFSGLAFAGIIFSLFLQRNDLKMQREEMQKSRKEFEQQNFNNVFFNLLKQQRELLEGALASVQSNYWDTNHFEGAKKLHGIALFEYFKGQQKALIKTISEFSRPLNFDPKNFNAKEYGENEQRQYNLNRDSDTKNNKGVFEYYNIVQKGFLKIEYGNTLQHSRLAYAYLFVKFHNSLSAYFRHMYHILVFIKQQKDEEIKSQKEITDDQKMTIIKKYNAYAGYLQAQMSPAELFLTFYNGLNFPKLQALLIEFNLLENLDEEELHGIKSGDIEGMLFRSRKNLISEALGTDNT